MKQLSRSEDYYQMRCISFPDCHFPTGRIAYTLAGAKPEEYELQIRLLELDGGMERRITAGGKREEKPKFSPDGRQLAFLSDAGGSAQVWVCGLTEGDGCRQVTTLRFGVEDFSWSPDGSRFGLCSSCPEDADPELLFKEETPEEKKKRLEGTAAEAVEITDYGYKSDEAGGYCRKTSRHLFLTGAGGTGAMRLTEGDRDHVMPVFSPDGRYLLYAGNEEQPREASIAMDLFLLSLDTMEKKRLTQDLWIAWYPRSFVPRFSPDGSFVAAGTLVPQYHTAPVTRLTKIWLDGRAPENLWPEDAPCHEATYFLYNTDNYPGAGDTSAMGSDGKWLYFLSGWQGSVGVYRAALEGAPKIEKVYTGEDTVRSIAGERDGKLILLKGDALETPQLYLYEQAADRMVRLTDSNPWMRTRALSAPESFRFHTLDGRGQVHCFVIPPQNREEGKRYPAVLYIHGGPTPFYGFSCCYEHQLMAAAGFAVILPNPRGTGGYGEKHGDLTQAEDGTAMYDLLQSVEEVCRRYPWIDPERVGVTGGSYGGYMTNLLAGRTERFRAAVAQRAIANELIQYASSDMAGSSKDFSDFRDFLKEEIKRSPIAWADRVRIPYLALHGMQDMRCPVEQAHQMYTAVKDYHPDLPVRMVLFPGENHSLTTEGRMMHRLRHYQEMIDWFVKYLEKEERNDRTEENRS